MILSNKNWVQNLVGGAEVVRLFFLYL